MSDVNEDRGDAATEFTENFIGERNDAEAVFWYGIYSLIMSFGLIVVYHLIDGTDWIAMYGGVDGFKYKWYGYVPIAMTWLAVSLFDSKMLRIIFKDMAAFSVMGPFWYQWKAFGDYLLLSEGGNQDLGYWLGAVVFFSWTVFEEIIQIILMPQILSWADDAGIKKE